MKNKIVLLSLIIISFEANSQVKKQYSATWESLDTHPMPTWYEDAKIGLSMHWGVYSVPAWAPREGEISYAEWYGYRMKDPENPTMNYHKENYGNRTYDDFIPEWKAENYDPEQWALFAKKMGAKYMFITSKHHDGFCLWPTIYTDRNAMKMGPGKDLLGHSG